MSKCRYELSEDCNNTDCLVCVLDKIRAEIEEINLIGYATVDGKREIARKAVMQIIDKNKAGSEG